MLAAGLLQLSGGHMQRIIPPRPVQHLPSAVVQPNRPARSQLPPYLILLLLGGGIGFGLILVVGLIMAMLVGGVFLSPNVLPGVEVYGSGIGSVPVGSLSVDEAAARLQAAPLDRKVILRDGSRTWEVSSADLGIALDGVATAQKAAEAGRSDLLTGVGTMLNGAQVAPVYTIDLAKAQNTLISMASKTDIAPSTTDIKANGRKLNVGATLDTLPPDLGMLLERGTLDLVMDVVEGPRTKYTVERGEELAIIAKKFNVAISDIVALNNLSDPDTIYPGQVLIIPAPGIWVPTEKDAPPAPLAKGKAIVVALRNQRIYAYEDGKLVHSALMSSGLPETETVKGDFNIYVKHVSTRMRGPDYDLPNVPWTMYFYRGYGIHGAYWHNTFGRVRSHGCVNLETNEAKWFFDFAPVGTLVRVIESF